jgi:hypothetical protein
MWFDWTKPLVDGTLIWLSHNAVFEKSSPDVIAIEAEASPAFQQHADGLGHFVGGVQERAVPQFEHTD